MEFPRLIPECLFIHLYFPQPPTAPPSWGHQKRTKLLKEATGGMGENLRAFVPLMPQTPFSALIQFLISFLMKFESSHCYGRLCLIPAIGLSPNPFPKKSYRHYSALCKNSSFFLPRSS
ncbi:hypothetical protein AVEN_83539-1 [Araneus ventricosus]|uniref:Uncharacterized protein n=1 Tax=Araneus ventricosus TaxID=182803 RepID=A0A4Y2H611_ARAVE|nr:hypothetical protein AVEN_83539-1 [Araneus ventricosus]